MRDFQSPGRSAVYSRNGMVATSHPLASEAGLACLKSGGNAVDAAVTAMALAAIAEPHMVGIGGDCFALVSEPDGSIHGLNASGRAPATADADRLRATGVTAITPDMVEAVTVPAGLRGFAALLSRFGRLGLDAALAPSIDLAEKGVPVAPRVAHDWAGLAPRLHRDAGARRHLLPTGEAPKVGDIVRFPALAATLRRIAEAGPDAFYAGPVGEDIVAAIAAHGGALTLEDLAGAKAEWVEPLSRAYRGREVVELPPNGQGAIALLILAILERFDMARLPMLAPERLHLEVEAARLAYGVRDAWLADPAFLTTPPAALLEEGFIDGLAGQIDPRRRNPAIRAAPPPPSGTVYVAAADGEGRFVSLIASLFQGFGSAIVAPETGVVLHSRGTGFSLAEGHPNEYAPDKRPLHTIIPALLRQDGQTSAAFGVMGGHFQAMGHAHLLGNLLDHDADPQAAIDCPRLFFNAERTVLETAMPRASREGLVAMGHELAWAPAPLGGAQFVGLDRARGVLVGASDPRKDGCALGY
ncbi:gamma-glutamyltransferase family protein [Afifella pfennigii]|uniref:gamma-glutamyltransferase family protein n=1 Tax=Afifella pfennigii TaxID=209897 RepID=UPI00047B06F9|nr:gamma-glutamyltransferase family protein [Afifella pfennigii]